MSDTYWCFSAHPRVDGRSSVASRPRWRRRDKARLQCRPFIERFFTERLMHQCNVSANTIATYTFRLRYGCGSPIVLTVAEFDATLIGARSSLISRRRQREDAWPTSVRYPILLQVCVVRGTGTRCAYPVRARHAGKRHDRRQVHFLARPRSNPLSRRHIEQFGLSAAIPACLTCRRAREQQCCSTRRTGGGSAPSRCLEVKFVSLTGVARP